MTSFLSLLPISIRRYRKHALPYSTHFTDEETEVKMEERICSRSYQKAEVITWTSGSNLFLGFIANIYTGGENIPIHQPPLSYQQRGRHGGRVD